MSINPDIGNIDGPTVIGPDGIAFQLKIEKLIQQGNLPEVFDISKKNLDDGLYGLARRGFEGYLGGEGSGEARTDAAKRSSALVYCAIATLARVRPDYRTTYEITTVARYLVAAQGHPLAPVLAALLCEDTRAGGIDRDRNLLAIARQGQVQTLEETYMRFLAKHLAPCAGPTWKSLRDHAVGIGITIEEFTVVQEVLPANPQREFLVPKYFIDDPFPPKPSGVAEAIVMLGIGLALFISSVAMVAFAVRRPDGLSSTGSDLLRSLCFGGLLLGGAVGMFIASGRAFSRYATYRSLRRWYELAWQIAQPKPSDQQIDAWLAEDIDLIVALGAARHNLSRSMVSEGGSLVIEPQTIVGRSSRRIHQVPLRHG